MKTMREMLSILNENADMDFRHHHPEDLDSFDPKEFSDKGRADIDTKGVYPRGDNAMANEIEEDFETIEPDPVQLDRLHQILNGELKQSDEAIRRGPIRMDGHAKQEIAAQLGVSIQDVEALNNTLTQKMRDQQGDDEENKLLLTSLGEEYRRLMQEIEPPEVLREAGQSDRPFEARFYAEQPDSLGNVTVRDTETGNTKYLQGGQASELRNRLAATQDADAVIAPLFEKAENPEAEDSYAAEIAAKSGTYNFPWHLGPHHGFATVFFNEDQELRLEHVLDMTGEEIPLDRIAEPQRAELLQQAHQLIDKGDV